MTPSWQFIAMLLVGMASCSDPMGSMAAAYCDVQDGDYLLDVHNDTDDSTPPIDCNFTKAQVRVDGTCRHAGTNWKHNWAADHWGNQLYPDIGPHLKGNSDDHGFGCDAQFVTGGGNVLLDGYVKKPNLQAIVFEMKTGGYENIQALSCPDMVKQQMLDRMVDDFKKSIAKEEPVAARCNLRYQLIFSDHSLKGLADNYIGNDMQVEAFECYDCNNPPVQPAGYIKSSVPLSTGYTRFWLDGAGQLQSLHFEGSL